MSPRKRTLPIPSPLRHHSKGELSSKTMDVPQFFTKPFDISEPSPVVIPSHKVTHPQQGQTQAQVPTEGTKAKREEEVTKSMRSRRSSLAQRSQSHREILETAPAEQQFQWKSSGAYTVRFN